MRDRPNLTLSVAGLTLRDDFEDGQPRVLDVDIGRRLGLVRPEDIRWELHKYADDLAHFGDLTSFPIVHGEGNRPSREYWLNMEQTFFVLGRSETQLGRALFREFIRVAGLSQPRSRR